MVSSEKCRRFDDPQLFAVPYLLLLERYITASHFTYSISDYPLTAREIKHPNELCRRDEILYEVARRVIWKQLREASLESKSQLDNGFFGTASDSLSSVHHTHSTNTLGNTARTTTVPSFGV
jgi:hypothetical protein